MQRLVQRGKIRNYISRRKLLRLIFQKEVPQISTNNASLEYKHGIGYLQHVSNAERHRSARIIPHNLRRILYFSVCYPVPPRLLLLLLHRHRHQGSHRRPLPLYPFASY